MSIQLSAILSIGGFSNRPFDLPVHFGCGRVRPFSYGDCLQVPDAYDAGHSESGFFPQHAALIDMDNIRGIISIELDCPANLSEVQVDILAKVPTLIIFGDYLGDVPDDPGNWVGALAGCEALAKRINDADGNTQVIHLPQLGIYGNSHMLMQDRNNLDVADIILTWLDETIEKRKVPIINKIK